MKKPLKFFASKSGKTAHVARISLTTDTAALCGVIMPTSEVEWIIDDRPRCIKCYKSIKEEE